MSPQNHIMLDLETMSTIPNAAILSIGAVRFSDVGIADTFYQTVSLSSSMVAGLTVDSDTIMWWVGQGNDAIESLQKDAIELPEALQAFIEWVGEEPFIWSNGANFDSVIIENAMRETDLKCPWHYGNVRCHRTITKLCHNVPKVLPLVPHHAMEDAKAQSLHLIECLRKLGKLSFISEVE